MRQRAQRRKLAASIPVYKFTAVSSGGRSQCSGRPYTNSPAWNATGAKLLRSRRPSSCTSPGSAHGTSLGRSHCPTDTDAHVCAPAVAPLAGSSTKLAARLAEKQLARNFDALGSLIAPATSR